MIDRAKIIRGLECCADIQRETINRGCDACPYKDDPEQGTCKTLYPLMRDAFTLLKADQMQLIEQRTRLENVIGERYRLKKRMQQFKFDLAICTEGGVAKGYEFRKGDIYPILGGNNGIQICYEDKEGDANVLMCHTWDCFAPIGGDAKFIYQDGTIPPLFEPLSRDFESAPEDWRADE